MLLCCSACGGSPKPPPRHGITADDPTPELPKYTPKPSAADARGPATSAPPPLPGASGGSPVVSTADPAAIPDTPPETEFGYSTPVQGCFEGQVYGLPPYTRALPKDFANLEQLSTIYACEWNIPVHNWRQGFPNVPDRVEWFAIHYTGSFTTQLPATYGFRVNSDDGSRLFIDGQLVVDNDGAHPARSRTGTIQLSPGSHDLTLDYFQGPRPQIALQVYVTANGPERVFSVRPQAP